MLKFEQIGVERQLESTNKYESLQSFKHSCNVCCHKGIHLECDRCAIAQTHSQVVAYFEDSKTTKR